MNATELWLGYFFIAILIALVCWRTRPFKNLHGIKTIATALFWPFELVIIVVCLIIGIIAEDQDPIGSFLLFRSL